MTDKFSREHLKDPMIFRSFLAPNEFGSPTTK